LSPRFAEHGISEERVVRCGFTATEAIAAIARKGATQVCFTGEISSGGVSIPLNATQAVNFQP